MLFYFAENGANAKVKERNGYKMHLRNSLSIFLVLCFLSCLLASCGMKHETIHGNPGTELSSPGAVVYFNDDNLIISDGTNAVKSGDTIDASKSVSVTYDNTENETRTVTVYLNGEEWFIVGPSQLDGQILNAEAGKIYGITTEFLTTNPNEGSSSSQTMEPITTVNPSNQQPAPEDPKNTIDIYLIAGQSNAVGHTRVTDREGAYAFAPELETGFSNVLFSGEARTDDGTKMYSRYYDWQKTKLGLGKDKSGNVFGPEAGMAKALSAYYNEESGRTAGLIKFGHGGTNLCNITTGSDQYGNWVSPSYAEYLQVSYQDDEATGGLYRRLLQVVKQQLLQLENLGYTNFNIKGLYWMQGENDRGNTVSYGTAFQYFVQDLRRDLSAIVEEITGGDDRGASQMPIFIGTISKTFDAATDSVVARNQRFINLQKTLPDLQGVGACVIVDNSNYDMTRMIDGTSVAVGSDRYHWNQEDHLAIGYNVGRAILEYYHYE